MVKVCSSVGGRIFRIEHAPIYPLLRLRVIGVNRGSDSFWGPRLCLTKTLYPLFNTCWGADEASNYRGFDPARTLVEELL